MLLGMKNKLLLAIAPALLFVGCTTDAKPEGATPESGGGISAVLVEKLVAADKLDGTEDKVVHKCAGCSLGMNGKKEMAVEVEGFEMHFCKPACKQRYETDAKGELEKLKVPAK